MMIKPLPQINEICSIVLQQEKEIMSVTPLIEPAVFFNRSTQSYGRGGGRSEQGREVSITIRNHHIILIVVVIIISCTNAIANMDYMSPIHLVLLIS